LYKKISFAFFLLFFFLVSSIHGDQEKKQIAHIGFGSCLNPRAPHPILFTIVNEQPDIFIFLGDNVYADTKDEDTMRARYRELAESPGFQQLRKTCPLLSVWDDHDYGANDAGKDYPMKRQSERIFEDFWNVPESSPRRRRQGVYGASYFGPPGRTVQVVLLDTRYFRTPLKRGAHRPTHARGPYLPQSDPGSHILGSEQWAWLRTELLKPAQVRLIVSSIQVLSEHHGWESWANFPDERARLFRMIEETGAEGVIFLSGDRHFAEISTIHPNGLYLLFDITSSGLNRTFPGKTPNQNRFRDGAFYLEENFGTIHIDWEMDNPLITARIQDISGKTVLEKKIFLHTLTREISRQ
jgi:alkaline phosphatase D